MKRRVKLPDDLNRGLKVLMRKKPLVGLLYYTGAMKVWAKWGGLDASWYTKPRWWHPVMWIVVIVLVPVGLVMHIPGIFRDIVYGMTIEGSHLKIEKTGDIIE